MSATGIQKQLAAPFVIVNIMQTFYTVPGSTKARVKQIILMNSHDSAVNVDLHMVPSGGSTSETNKMFKGSAPSGLSLRTFESKVIDLDTVLETGESIQAIANISPKIVGCISGMEITGTTLYKTLWLPTLIPSTGISVLGYPGNVVPAATKVRLKEVILMNDHSAVVNVSMNLVPSGGAPALNNTIFLGASPHGLNLQPGETKILGLDQVLEVGQAINFNADIEGGGGGGTNKVTCRGSGLEIT